MTPQAIEFAKDVETGKPVKTTIKDMISNRMLWEGDSGSGKSHGMTGVIEKTDGLAQRIIIDPEGEYFPLKDNFQFLLIGQKTEQVTPNVILNTNDVYVDKLVKKLIEFSNDAIIDLSEDATEATHFLKIFQIAIFKYAKLMKRPLLIFVDEAHIFAPEKGQGTEESLVAMKNLAKRGRKRGIGLVCGTQAIADFSKDVVRQLKMRFIGNCTYDNDVKAAAHFLGFGKEREPELRDLGEEHHFFLSGKGVTVGGKKPKHVIKIQCDSNKTKLFDFDFNKNFKLKEKDAAEMKKLAENFSDIPQLIDEELNEKERLQKDNFEMKKQLQENRIKIIQLERQQPKVDPKAVEKAYNEGHTKAIKFTELQFTKFQNDLKTLMRTYKPIFQRVATLANELSKFEQVIPELDKFLNTKLTLKLDKDDATHAVQYAKIAMPQQNVPNKNNVIISAKIPEGPVVVEMGDVKLNGPETKILTAVLQAPGQRGTKKRIALYCGYAVKGGAYANILGRLRTNGFIIYEGGEVVATEKGIAAIPNYEPLPLDPQAIISFWTNKLGQAKGKVLAAIYENSPISKEELAEKTQYAASGGAFANILGALRTLGLIDYLPDKKVEVSKEIFPEMYA